MAQLTVLMPVYNASRYLSEAIESVINQSFKEFELFILNDKSTDNSLEIINKYAQLDSRIRVHDFEENKGAAGVRNWALKHINTKYTALMDADDIALESKYQKQFNLLESQSNIDICGTWFKIFGDKIESKIIKHYESQDELKIQFLNDCYIGTPTVMFRTEILNGLSFDVSMNPIDDYELWTRLIYTFNFYNIQETLFHYRWHDSNISHSSNVDLTNMHLQVRANQLSHLGISTNIKDSQVYLEALMYTGVKTLDEVVVLLKAAAYLKNQNKIKNIYNHDLFVSVIDEALVKYINNINTYSFDFLKGFLNGNRSTLNLLNSKKKSKIWRRGLKSIFKS